MFWPNDSETSYHLLCQLLCPDNHILLSGSDRVSSLLSWLWQVCWNFQSSVLYHHYEHLGLHTVGSGNLGWCLLSNSHTNYCNSCSLLWTQYHQPFFLWDPGPTEACLFRHPCQPDSGSGYQCIHTAPALYLHSHVLLPHYDCYAEDSFCGGQAQSFLYL